jgi:ribosomal protein S18 acetylase RimI-like enzyme
MYIYHQGLIIREGTTGLKSESIKELFIDAGWHNSSRPMWQDEKFQIMFENSTWAFTVWDQENLVGMVRVVSDRVMMATIMDLIIQSEYRNKGIGKKLIELSLQKLPHGDWFAYTSANNFDFYKKCGFEVKDISSHGACVFHGFIQARKQGDRLF